MKLEWADPDMYFAFIMPVFLPFELNNIKYPETNKIKEMWVLLYSFGFNFYIIILNAISKCENNLTLKI